MFVDDADDIENFDAAAHFDTHEDVLSRAANRPRTSTLLGKVCSGVSKKTVDEVRRRRRRRHRHRRFFVSHQSLIFLLRSTENAMLREFALLKRLCAAAALHLSFQIPRTDGQDETAEGAEGGGRGAAVAAQLDGAPPPCPLNFWLLLIFRRPKARKLKWGQLPRARSSTSGSRNARNKAIRKLWQPPSPPHSVTRASLFQRAKGVMQA